MKQLSLLVILAAVLQTVPTWARASVFEKDIANESATNRTLKVGFMVNTENPELGRAWITAYYDEAYSLDSDTVLPKPMEIAVPGLHYQADSKQIVYTKSDGSKVVCADRVEKGFVHGLTYNETGKCTLDLSPATIKNDNGFFVTHERGSKITLNIHD